MHVILNLTCSNSSHSLNFISYLQIFYLQGSICENSGAAITCRDDSMVELTSNCTMERNGIDAIIKDEYNHVEQSKEEEVQAKTAAALILS